MRNESLIRSPVGPCPLCALVGPLWSRSYRPAHDCNGYSSISWEREGDSLAVLVPVKAFNEKLSATNGIVKRTHDHQTYSSLHSTIDRDGSLLASTSDWDSALCTECDMRVGDCKLSIFTYSMSIDVQGSVPTNWVNRVRGRPIHSRIIVVDSRDLQEWITLPQEILSIHIRCWTDEVERLLSSFWLLLSGNRNGPVLLAILTVIKRVYLSAKRKRRNVFMSHTLIPFLIICVRHCFSLVEGKKRVSDLLVMREKERKG